VEKRELPIFGHIQDYAGAKVSEWCIGGPERSENSWRCGSVAVLQVVGDNLVVDFVNKTAQELLAIVGILFDGIDPVTAEANGDCCK